MAQNVRYKSDSPFWTEFIRSLTTTCANYFINFIILFIFLSLFLVEVVNRVDPGLPHELDPVCESPGLSL